MRKKPRKAKGIEKFIETVQTASHEALGVIIEDLRKEGRDKKDVSCFLVANMLTAYREKKFPKKSEQTQAQAQAGHGSDLIDKFIVARV
jgi:hypothetical protein